MDTTAEGKKAKSARRMIEVLEFFDNNRQEATVMDIVRRYNRPQSSTSELLASLVELGLLYKAPGSRSYRLTPRAAMLGSTAQPSVIRDGTICRIIDQLHAETGLGTVLVGKVNLSAQVLQWQCSGEKSTDGDLELWSGAMEPLHKSAAGRLLLSTVERRQREAMIRRLNAEATEDDRFSYAEMVETVLSLTKSDHVTGPAGFDADREMTGIRLPVTSGEPPMVLGFVYRSAGDEGPDALIKLLRSTVDEFFEAYRTPRRNGHTAYSPSLGTTNASHIPPFTPASQGSRSYV